MRLTRSGGYGIYGLLYLARRRNRDIAYVGEVSSALNISASFLAKIFQTFARSGILISHRGMRGGYSFARSPYDISLREVIEAAQGPIALSKCLSKGNNPCGRYYYCGLREVLGNAQEDMKAHLESTSIGQLVDSTRFHD
jgi:Rrf2 family iron-sulfur cluster assembly transcriptional regulator